MSPSATAQDHSVAFQTPPAGRDRRRRRMVTLTVAAMLGTVGAVALAPPAHAATTPQIYVGLLSDGVAVLDTVSGATVTTISTGSNVRHVALNPTGTALYAANEALNSVSAIDTATNTVTATIPVGGGPYGLAISPAGTAYVTNSEDATVSAIDTSSNTVTTTIAVDDVPGDVVVNRAGTIAYVANVGGGSISVIDTASNTVTATIPVASPWTVAVNPSGTKLYVAGLDSSLRVIDLASNAVTATIPIPTANVPFVTIDPTGAAAYVSDFSSGGVVYVIDTAGDTITAEVPTGDFPSEVGFNRAGTLAYVPSNSGLSVIDTTTQAVVATVGSFPSNTWGVAVLDLGMPTVTGISPTSGPTSGGTQVTITGTRFFGATGVHFGANPATSFTVNSDTSITATAPPGAAATVHVTVTTPEGTTATSPAGQYTYVGTADLAITLASQPSGTSIAYTITATNHGPSALTAATITANINPGFTVPSPTMTSTECAVDAAGRSATCTLGSLAAGASTTRHVTVQTGLLSIGLGLSVTASRTTSTPTDPNAANDQATRSCLVNLLVVFVCS